MESWHNGLFEQIFGSGVARGAGNRIVQRSYNKGPRRWRGLLILACQR